MVNAVVDTAVIIDVMRGFAPATQWLSTQAFLGMTPIIALELLQGAENKQAVQRILKRIRSFERVKLTDDDYDWAIARMAVFKLSHNVGMIDCLIAAPCYRLQLPLYTQNLKHFTPLLGTLAIRPY